MGGKNYIKGAAFENTVKHYLEDLGYLVTRSAKSRGAWDLMSWNGEECMLVQCKTDNKISKADAEYLRLTGEQYHCRVVVAYKTSLRGIPCEMRNL